MRKETWLRQEMVRWHVRLQLAGDHKYEGAIGGFNGWQQFRLRYRVPASALSVHVPAAPLWQAAIDSAAFNNRGRVD